MKDCYLVLPTRGKTLMTTLKESAIKPQDFPGFYLVTPMTVVLRVDPTRTPKTSGGWLNFAADHDSEAADFSPILPPIIPPQLINLGIKPQREASLKQTRYSTFTGLPLSTAAVNSL